VHQANLGRRPPLLSRPMLRYGQPFIQAIVTGPPSAPIAREAAMEDRPILGCAFLAGLPNRSEPVVRHLPSPTQW
jgi:hypothetical protein